MARSRASRCAGVSSDRKSASLGVEDLVGGLPERCASEGVIVVDGLLESCMELPRLVSDRDDEEAISMSESRIIMPNRDN